MKGLKSLQLRKESMGRIQDLIKKKSIPVTKLMKVEILKRPMKEIDNIA
jgi:hypothetical protein